MNDTKELMTLTEATKYLGLCKTTVWQMIKNHKLKAKMIGDLGYVIKLSDVEAIRLLREEQKNSRCIPTGYVGKCLKHGLLLEEDAYKRATGFYRCKACAKNNSKQQTRSLSRSMKSKPEKNIL